VQKDVTDCVIVGAGPVGLTLACQLQQYGVSCRVLDKLSAPVQRTKAAALWSRSAEIFAQIGLVDAAVENGLKVYGASFLSGGKRVARLNLDSIDSLYNYVLMIAQHKTEQVLRDYLQEQGVTVEYASHVTDLEQSDESVKITLESGEPLEARWVVGCDGAHSFVRQHLGLSFDGQELESRWIVGDLEVEGVPHKDELVLIMHKDGPAGLFPLGDSLYRVVAETESADSVAEAEVVLSKLVEHRVGAPDVSVKQVYDAGYFSIHERQVDQYRVGRVFLAGDSAHVQSPIGGQGMNTGIQDANNLAWKLALVAKGLAKEGLLETYHEERQPVAEWLVDATSHGTAMVTNQNPLVAAFRGQATRLMAAVPMVGNKLRNTLSELEINYRGSTISREAEYVGSKWGRKEGVRAGERAPDGVVWVGGEQRRLSEYLRKCQFHLLLFDNGDRAASNKLAKLLRLVRRSHQAMVQSLLISRSTQNEEKSDGLVLMDIEKELHRLYGATQPAAYIIRPDGYVAYRSKPVDQVELLNYLDDWRASS
jgi:2-polyprenyl-6-methoxyphenol hydroxylase-like FAD-dependent oxidoreductase